MVSRLDYGNGLLVGTSESNFSKLQRLQNRAARLLARPRATRGRPLYITPVLRELHWLPVSQRVLYKLCVHVYGCLRESAPEYLQQLIRVRIRDSRLRPASCNELVARVPRRRVGHVAFSVAGPNISNLLPESLHPAATLSQLKSGLKTYMWTLAYGP